MINLEIKIDEDKLKSVIEASLSLKDDEQFFEQLSSVELAKKELKDALEVVETLESEAKGLINAKAKALYGSDWDVIKGQKFKIGRSPTGSVFSIIGKPDKQFLEVKESVNTMAVEAYVLENSSLPEGLDYNPARGESIKITVQLS